MIAGLASAKKAGDAILEVYRSAFAIELKDDRSPLTLADKRAHEIIVRELGNSPLSNGFGRLPLLSEEGKYISYGERNRWDWFWLIDPLDGTKEFIKRNGEFTVNIALIHKTRPVLGIIYVPVRETFFYAARTIGSYRMDGTSTLGALFLDRKIPDEVASEQLKSILDSSRQLRPVRTGGESRIITVVGSRSHGSEALDGFLNRLKERFETVNLVSAGSSLKFCMVAEGSADLYVRHGPTMEWDTAAGQIIVEEAGGAVLNLATAAPLEYNKENLLNPAFLAACGDLQAITDLR